MVRTGKMGPAFTAPDLFRLRPVWVRRDALEQELQPELDYAWLYRRRLDQTESRRGERR